MVSLGTGVTTVENWGPTRRTAATIQILVEGSVPGTMHLMQTFPHRKTAANIRVTIRNLNTLVPILKTAAQTQIWNEVYTKFVASNHLGQNLGIRIKF